MIKKISQDLKQRAHHFLFLLVIICLVLLTVWWIYFIKRSIDQTHHLQTMLAEKQARIIALEIKLSSSPLTVGIIKEHGDYEITTREGGLGSSLITTGYYVQPTSDYIFGLEKERRKKEAMVFGEGFVFGLSLLVSCFMLYLYIRLEKRSREELYEFWNRVTHEIKTPITGIRAFLETLKTGSLSPNDLDYMVDLALKQVEKQQQLTQNILVGRQLDKGLRQSQVEPMRMVRFVEKYLENHSLQLSRIETHILRSGLPIGTRCQADPNSVHTIMDNLVDNALKYGPKDLKLVFSFRQEGDLVSICLKDNGPGFPPEMGDRLFDAYRRLAGELPEGKHGTGMGLHICRSLARQMGGEMTAHSEGIGKGASFRLILNKIKEEPL